MGRAAGSMTLIWSTSTTPLIGPPSGNETSNGQSRPFRVIGQTTSTEDWALYCRPESTSAGRRPPCSCPIGGPKSSHSTSPESGASAAFATLHLSLTLHGFPLLIGGRDVTPVVIRPRHLDRGPILEWRRLLAGLDSGQEIFKAVLRNLASRGSFDCEAGAVFFEVYSSSRRQPKLLRHMLRQAQRQAISPFCNFGLHGSSGYTVYIQDFRLSTPSPPGRGKSPPRRCVPPRRGRAAASARRTGRSSRCGR